MDAFMNWLNDIANGLSTNPQIRAIAANNKLLAPLIENPFILLFLVATVVYFLVSKLIKHFRYMSLKDDIDLQAKLVKQKKKQKALNDELDDNSEINSLRRKLELERQEKERIERERRDWELEKLRLQTEKEKEELRRMINGGVNVGVPGGINNSPYNYPPYTTYPPYSGGYIPPTGPISGPGIVVPPSIYGSPDTTPKETKVEAPEVIIKEVPVIREVIKEVPVEKEVVKEVEVIKEVAVEKEIIKEIPVIKEVTVEVEKEVIVEKEPVKEKLSNNELKPLPGPEEKVPEPTVLEEGIINSKFSDGFDNNGEDTSVADILVPDIIKEEPKEEIKEEEPKELINYLPDVEEEPEEIEVVVEGDAYEQFLNKWNKESDKKKKFQEKIEQIQSVKETNMEILNQRSTSIKEELVEEEKHETVDTDLSNLSSDDLKRMKSAQKAVQKEQRKQEKAAAKEAAKAEGKKKRLF